MRLDGSLDLNLIRVFVTIYEARSVTRAAARLAVTQPTISYALAKLRKVYSDHLFVHSRSGLTPTVLADQLFVKFRDALAQVESTMEDRREFAPAESTRRFRLAMSDIATLFFVPPLLGRFQEVAPRIEVEIVEISDSMADDLATGKIEFAIGNVHALGLRIRSSALFREHYVCLMSAVHPTIGDEMTLPQFASARHIMVESPSSGHRLVDEELARRGVSRNIVARRGAGVHGCLVPGPAQFEDRIRDQCRRAQAGDHFDQPHLRYRVEKVHSDQVLGSLEAVCDRSDGDGRCVAGKNAMRPTIPSSWR